MSPQKLVAGAEVEKAFSVAELAEKIDDLLRGRNRENVKLQNIITFLEYMNAEFPAFQLRLLDIFSYNPHLRSIAREEIEQSVSFGIYETRIKALGRGDFNSDEAKREFRAVWCDILSEPFIQTAITEDEKFIREIIFESEALDAGFLLKCLMTMLSVKKKDQKAQTFKSVVASRWAGFESSLAS